MKKLLLMVCGVLYGASPSYATVTTASLSNYTIPYETVGTPTNVTINFTIDAISNVEVDIFFLRNVTDVPSAENQVAAIQQNGLSVGAHTIPWNALWLLGGDLGRQNGSFQVIVHANNGATTSDYVIDQLLTITSVDIHNVVVAPSFDADHNPSLPYVISYALAKDSLVTIQVKNSGGTVVRTLGIPDSPQYNENIKTNSVVWNGLDDDGLPVPLGIYTVTLDAKDTATGSTDRATTRTRTATIQSLAGLEADAQELFENNAFVYPNPIRANDAGTACGTPACFQFLAVRNNASISLKIYTIDGTLVRSENFDGLTTGNIKRFNWDVANQSGKPVGRGLYYFVAREQDAQGTLQTVKRIAVIR